MKTKGDFSKKRADIRDVAKRAKISTSTVSNYLNKTAPVNKETAKRIQEAIEKLDYKPNNIARGLRGGITKTIGVILPEITESFYSDIVNGIEEIASKNNYTLVLSSHNYSIERERNQINNLLNNYISGFIFCTGGLDFDEIIKIQNRGTPVVAVDRKIANTDIPSIEIDNFKSFYNATKYLINNGHRNIYYISEPIIMGILEDRLEGFKRALKDNGLEIDNSKIIIDETLQTQKTPGGFKIMKELLINNIKPDAVIATADDIIYGAMRAALEFGFKVPDDISFLGNNDNYLSAYTYPSLTTIRQPKEDMGKKAMELLLNLIDKKNLGKKKIFLETVLVERQSVKKHSL